MECRQFYAHCFSKWKDNSFENSLLKLCRKICLNSKGILPSTNIFCEMSDVHSFKNGYHKMCDYLFLQKSTSSYAIALITFSLELDKQMSQKYTDWYTTDLLIDILDTNLRKINFSVEIVNQEMQTKLLAKYIFDYCSYCFNHCSTYNVNYILHYFIKKTEV